MNPMVWDSFENTSDIIDAMTIFTQTLQGSSFSGLSPASEFVPHTSPTSTGGLPGQKPYPWHQPL